MLEQFPVRLVNDACLQRFQIDLRGLLGVVPHGLANDGQWDVLSISRCGPGVAADIGG